MAVPKTRTEWIARAREGLSRGDRPMATQSAWQACRIDYHAGEPQTRNPFDAEREPQLHEAYLWFYNVLVKGALEREARATRAKDAERRTRWLNSTSVAPNRAVQTTSSAYAEQYGGAMEVVEERT